MLSDIESLYMTVAILGIRLLELMFFVGLAGSAIVVLISDLPNFKFPFGLLIPIDWLMTRKYTQPRAEGSSAHWDRDGRFFVPTLL